MYIYTNFYRYYLNFSYRRCNIYFENRGNNSFGIQKYITTNKSTSVYSADIDGDEDNDVLSCSKDNNSLIWFQNDGTGNFSNQQVVDSNINSPISIYITDLDKDGDNDILSNSFIYFHDIFTPFPFAFVQSRHLRLQTHFPVSLSD